MNQFAFEMVKVYAEEGFGLLDFLEEEILYNRETIDIEALKRIEHTIKILKEGSVSLRINCLTDFYDSTLIFLNELSQPESIESTVGADIFNRLKTELEACLHNLVEREPIEELCTNAQSMFDGLIKEDLLKPAAGCGTGSNVAPSPKAELKIVPESRKEEPPRDRDLVSNIVLVIDDDSTTLKLVEELTRDEGYKTVTTTSGVEGLRLFEELRPDVVITDYQMESMDGQEVLRRIREIDSTVPVCVFSGHSSREHVINFIQGGAHTFIDKPLDEDLFLNSIHKAMQETRTRRLINELMKINLKIFVKTQMLTNHPKVRNIQDVTESCDQLRHIQEDQKRLTRELMKLDFSKET